jgi:hypothetical protein
MNSLAVTSLSWLKSKLQGSRKYPSPKINRLSMKFMKEKIRRCKRAKFNSPG